MNAQKIKDEIKRSAANPPDAPLAKSEEIKKVILRPSTEKN